MCCHASASCSPRPDERTGGAPGRRHRHRGRSGGCGRGVPAPDEGDLRRAILALLAGQPRTGIETMRALAGCRATVPLAAPDFVYPNLRLLEDMGMIVATTDAAGRTTYALVPDAEPGGEATGAPMSGGDADPDGGLPAPPHGLTATSGRCRERRRTGGANGFA